MRRRALGVSALAEPFLGEGLRHFTQFLLASFYRKKVILAKMLYPGGVSRKSRDAGLVHHTRQGGLNDAVSS